MIDFYSIFSDIVSVADYVVSFLYRFSFLDFSDGFSYIMSGGNFEFTTLLSNAEVFITMPYVPLISEAIGSMLSLLYGWTAVTLINFGIYPYFILCLIVGSISITILVTLLKKVLTIIDLLLPL